MPHPFCREGITYNRVHHCWAIFPIKRTNILFLTCRCIANYILKDPSTLVFSFGILRPCPYLASASVAVSRNKPPQRHMDRVVTPLLIAFSSARYVPYRRFLSWWRGRLLWRDVIFLLRAEPSEYCWHLAPCFPSVRCQRTSTGYTQHHIYREYGCNHCWIANLLWLSSWTITCH